MKASIELLWNRLQKRNLSLHANSPFIITDEILEHHYNEFQEPKDFSHLKAKLVLITSNKKMTNYPGIDLCICYGHTSSVQTHSILYPLINDMIVMKYREFIRKKSRNKNLLFLVSKMRTFKGISKIML